MIEIEYGYENKNCFKEDFHTLINNKNWSNCFLIIKNINTNDEYLVGHIGTKKRQLILKGKKHNCLLIGGIVIGRQFQGKEFSNHYFQTLSIR